MDISTTKSRLKDYPEDHIERLKYEVLLNSQKKPEIPKKRTPSPPLN
jgi:hypothetical protein